MLDTEFVGDKFETLMTDLSTSPNIFVTNKNIVAIDESQNCSSWTRPEEKQLRSAKIDFLGFKSFLVGTQFIVAQSQSSILRDQTLSDF